MGPEIQESLGGAMETADVFDDFSLWAPVKLGDTVTILVNGKEYITSLVCKDGAMGLLKRRTLDALKEEGARQMGIKEFRQ
jgi:hypothetical protein